MYNPITSVLGKNIKPLNTILISLFMLTFSLVADDLQKTDQNGYFYFGLGSGWMSLNNDLTEESFKTYPLLIVGGYQINNYIAIEGRHTRSVLDIKYDKGTTNNANNSDYRATFKNSALYLKPMYTINTYSAYLLLGYGEVALNDIKGSKRAEKSFQWGVGASFKFTDRVSFFIDYSNLYNAKGFDGRAKKASVDVDFVAVGVNYAF